MLNGTDGQEENEAGRDRGEAGAGRGAGGFERSGTGASGGTVNLLFLPVW